MLNISPTFGVLIKYSVKRNIIIANIKYAIITLPHVDGLLGFSFLSARQSIINPTHKTILNMLNANTAGMPYKAGRISALGLAIKR